MKINWKVRIRNKVFWTTLIPALALLAQAIATVFGFTIDLDTLVGQIIAVVDALFAVLVILGINVDPTTSGFGDSDRALGYEKPWVDEEKKEEGKEA